MNKYNGWYLWDLVNEANKKNLSGKDARMLHRELRKHHVGLPLFMRYPDLPFWIYIAALLLVVAGAILRSIPEIR